jgi:hypothetical protein
MWVAGKDSQCNDRSRAFLGDGLGLSLNVVTDVGRWRTKAFVSNVLAD